ncbi:MAG: InlB B-repeat-containing protein [Clostridia bacterium]|nr:InlB B-repeat-containing protein [Clostridia bacterium]
MMTVFLTGGAAAEQTEAHTHEGWTAVETLPTASGQYYLAKDIEISSAWTIGSGVEISLCLNDHSITMTAAGLEIIIDGGTLNLYDCGTTEHSYTTDTWPAVIGSGSGSFTGGYITHAAGKNGPAIRINKGEFNMYGGTLIGNNNVNDQYYSGAVDMAAGTFNLYNGTIAGNQGSSRLGGGAVYKTGGAMNIYGGEIRHNYAEYGGGVLSYGGTTIMRGGSIHHNTGNAAGGFFIAEGTVSMSGGSIADNSAANVGGMVVNGTFNMSGGSITGNTDSSEYGCICIGGTMNLSGGSITGNTSKDGAVQNAGTFNISGNPVVTGNKAPNGNEINVYLPRGKTVNVTGTMTGGASVGITTETAPTAGNPVKFGLKYKTNNTDSPDKWFTSDKGYDVLVMNDTADQNAYVAAKVTLTYDGNGADSGNVPAAKTVTHGTVVTVEGAGTLKKADHFFSGWGLEPGSRRSVESGDAASDDEGRGFYDSGDSIEMDGNITLYAQWDEGHTVTWQNGDGSVLDEKTWKSGDPEPETEKTPTKKPDEQYIYTFFEWEEPVIDEDGNRIYKPKFTTTLQKYTITFVDEDNSVLKAATEYEYGNVPVKPEDPAGKETEKDILTFTGWSDGTTTYAPGATLPEVKKNMIYKAVYSAADKPAATAAVGLGAAPSESPSASPSATPTATPAAVPAATPAPTVTAAPTATQTPVITAAPTVNPTTTPTAAPTLTPKPVPKTGDSEDLFLWTGLMALCAGVLAVMLFAIPYLKRRK